MGDTNIIVRGMKMPKNCHVCPLVHPASVKCRVTDKYHNWGLPRRPKDCPLFEVKDWREI